MKISDILREDKTTISFEVFPPKTTANFESVKKAALGVAALHPDYMSVTYGAGGSDRGNTLHIAEEIQKAENVTTIAHLTCVGAGKEDIRTALSEMKEAGIENILALRGGTDRRILTATLLRNTIMPPNWWQPLRNTAISAWAVLAIRRDIPIPQTKKRILKTSKKGGRRL